MLKAVYALVGSDIFLQLQKQAELLKDAPADAQRIEIDGERAELAQVLDEVRSFAMFGGHKIVTVRDAEEFISRFREQVEKYLASPVDSATLILRCNTLQKSTRVYKLVEKLGGICVCEPSKQLTGWISSQAKDQHGLSLTSDAARLLADLVGPDPARLDSELAKLALVADGKRIAPMDISGTVAFQKELEMVELTNSLTAGDINEAVRRWHRLAQLDPGGEHRVFTWIAIWLGSIQKGLKMKRAGRGTYDICKEARIWDRDLQEPFIRTMAALGEQGTEKALAQLAEAEYQSKTGVGDTLANVERFLLSLKLNSGDGNAGRE